MKVPFLIIVTTLATITLNAQEAAGGPFGSYSAIVIIPLILFILVVLFLIFRQVNLWYWKIDERIKLHERTNSLLQKLVDRTEPMQEPEPEKSFSGTITDLNDPGAMEEVLKRFSKPEQK